MQNVRFLLRHGSRGCSSGHVRYRYRPSTGPQRQIDDPDRPRPFFQACWIEGTGRSSTWLASLEALRESRTGSPTDFTKAAVIGLTNSIAVDYAARGIRCNAICPGAVETPSLSERFQYAQRSEKSRSDGRSPQRRQDDHCDDDRSCQQVPHSGFELVGVQHRLDQKQEQGCAP